MQNFISQVKLSTVTIICTCLFIMASNPAFSKKQNENNQDNFTVYKGKVVDAKSLSALVFATVAIEGTNIATVTNVEGKFSLKVPNNTESKQLKVAFIGYESLTTQFSELKPDKNNVLKLNPVSVAITEIKVFPNDPVALIGKVLSMRSKNYMNEDVLMTAFYRETIQKRKTYVGLSEAVVQVRKASYTGHRGDQIKLFKGRKNSDTKKLDTLLFKLQGGPHSTLALDIVKDPYMILDNEVIEMYDYKIANITRIDEKLNYILEFKQKPHVTQPLFYGKIFIDADNYAISSVQFSLNTENRFEASNMFIKKKPIGVNVYPESASYIVNYRENNGKWQYNYSRGEVTFKVKWKKKLLNTTYTTMVEMASTNWELAKDKPFKASDRLKMNVVMSDAILGFADTDFWGEYNIIEPEQSIEVAIKKIKKKISKTE